MTTTFKHISIDLVGEDGNAHSIMGRVQKAMRNGNCTPRETTEVLDEMKNGDYDHLLATVMNIFSVDGENSTQEWDEDDEVCEGCGESLEYCDCC